jgi:UDP-hydrolysing UDP-N-acetyl-D-glucosamine 2-epimerase
MSPRKICVVTGSRAEYGLLFWLMKEIQADEELKLQLVVTGMHLSQEYGETWKEIEEDGFHIDEKVNMLLSGDSPTSIVKSMGLANIGFADAYAQLLPDLVVLLGDRFEILSAAQSAMVMRIPIAHIHGGEATEGAIDEAIRHAVTKMSQLHFVSAEVYRKRVIQLGEQPDHVFTVGATGLDHLNRQTFYDRNELEAKLGFSLGEQAFMVTYHPATLEDKPPGECLQELLDALNHFPDVHLIITYPNADTYGHEIIDMLKDYAKDNPGRVLLVKSLGQLGYLSALQHVDLIIGNSSSGIIEAPSFRIPTVNLGNRQQGRLRADSVIDAEENKSAIIRAIDKALSSDFREGISGIVNPYGDGQASPRIVNVLKKVELKGILKKKFYDLPVQA